jgi:hypothetical protein
MVVVCCITADNGRPLRVFAAKKSWRGCGKHIPAAMSAWPEAEWCSCDPKVEVDGKAYPHAARVAIPGASWLSGIVGGGQKKDGKDEL